MNEDAFAEQLLNRAAAGDGLAVEGLLGMHRDRLRNLVSRRIDRRIAGRADASDVVQETLAEAARQLPQFLRRSERRFYPWLRQIAWERLIDLHRRHLYAQRRSAWREVGRQESVSDDSRPDPLQQIPAEQATPSQDSVRRELNDRLHDALQHLGEHDREILELRYEEQLAVQQVADTLGLTEAATQSRLRRAVERLHDLLAPSQDVQPAN